MTLPIKAGLDGIQWRALQRIFILQKSSSRSPKRSIIHYTLTVYFVPAVVVLGGLGQVALHILVGSVHKVVQLVRGVVGDLRVEHYMAQLLEGLGPLQDGSHQAVRHELFRIPVHNRGRQV